MYFAHNTSDRNRYRRIVSTCFLLFIACCLPLAAQVNIFTGETLKQMQLDPGLV